MSAGPGTPSVIAVDDHADVVEPIGIVLEREGCAVRCAATAQDALGAIETLRPDLEISDVHMPGMGELALAATLRSRRDPAPVLPRRVDRLPPDRATPFLPEPFALGALVAQVGAAFCAGEAAPYGRPGAVHRRRFRM